MPCFQFGNRCQSACSLQFARRWDYLGGRSASSLPMCASRPRICSFTSSTAGATALYSETPTTTPQFLQHTSAKYCPKAVRSKPMVDLHEEHFGIISHPLLAGKPTLVKVLPTSYQTASGGARLSARCGTRAILWPLCRARAWPALSTRREALIPFERLMTPPVGQP